jgi:hypothetical protein
MWHQRREPVTLLRVVVYPSRFPVSVNIGGLPFLADNSVDLGHNWSSCLVSKAHVFSRALSPFRTPNRAVPFLSVVIGASIFIVSALFEQEHELFLSILVIYPEPIVFIRFELPLSSLFGFINLLLRQRRSLFLSGLLGQRVLRD